MDPSRPSSWRSSAAAFISLSFVACGGSDVTNFRDFTESTGTSGLGGAGAVASPAAAEAPAPGGAEADAGGVPASELGMQPVPSGPNGAADAGSGSSSEGELAFDCSALPAAPLAFEELPNFTTSEDFAFDDAGNYVGIDALGNLVRISADGQKQLWSPALGLTAGMVLLPDGSLIFSDVEQSALRRVHPSGAVGVVLGGVSYPNGLALGADGYVYVAENGAGRVRRVDPESGEFSVVAMGLEAPNGIAFGVDPSVLYVGSFGGSGVYRVDIPAPGELGFARVFARPNGSTLREPRLSCPDGLEGVACDPGGFFLAGECRALANVVDCVQVDPCPGLEEEAYCDYPGPGTCRGGRCIEEVDPCDGRRVGDACEHPALGAGSCEASLGFLQCVPVSPCADLRVGAPCVDPLFGEGRCEGVEGQLFCSPPNACEGLGPGAPCEDAFIGAGVCQSFESETGVGLYCAPPNSCTGSRAGAACDDGLGAGVCADLDGTLYCVPPEECSEQADGAECFDATLGNVGTCRQGQCLVAETPGGIDGIGVDACGNVYATEYAYGYVWRVSPSGEVELLTELPSHWIPNLRWGRDLGGFSKQTLYVADRMNGSLFALPVGVSEARESRSATN